MGILKEFKAFAMKGNVVDMAVGIIIGALVNDVIMPPIGVLVGGVNFTDLSITIKEAVGDAAAVTINYGNFIQVIFDFLIIAAAIFGLVKVMNSMKRKEEESPSAPPAPSKEEVLLSEIRDILKSK